MAAKPAAVQSPNQKTHKSPQRIPLPGWGMSLLGVDVELGSWLLVSLIRLETMRRPLMVKNGVRSMKRWVYGKEPSSGEALTMIRKGPSTGEVSSGGLRRV